MVLDNTSRCMQRLGFLKYVVYRCSQQDATIINDLGKDLIDKVTKKYTSHLTINLQEYVTKRLKDRVYKKLREAVSKIELHNNMDQTFQIELQDLYLSSKDIASKTGKLVSQDREKYPYLSSSLSLVRKGSYSLLVRGKVFLEFTRQPEINAFINLDLETNPFILTPVQKLFFLYTFIEKDGNVLKQLYSNLLNINGSFTDRQAGDFLPLIYSRFE